MSFDPLIQRIAQLENPTVAGLDPQLSYLPSFLLEECRQRDGDTLKAAGRALYRFNKSLIDALYDVVPAIKPQAAYYEQYGWHGVKALAKTIAYAKEKGMYVITDGKRNDSGTTMQAYTNGHLGQVQVGESVIEPFAADALTVNGYLGTDGITPLLNVCRERDKGIFVLVKTSNPSSGELQDLPMADGRPLYRIMGGLCETWGSGAIGKSGYSDVGAVIGATYPEQLAELRKALPHTFFLVPGYGAQGGGAQGIKGAYDSQGGGVIVNSSRAIMCAYRNKPGYAEEDFADAAREEALRMKAELLSVR